MQTIRCLYSRDCRIEPEFRVYKKGKKMKESKKRGAISRFSPFLLFSVFCSRFLLRVFCFLLLFFVPWMQTHDVAFLWVLFIYPFVSFTSRYQYYGYTSIHTFMYKYTHTNTLTDTRTHTHMHMYTCTLIQTHHLFCVSMHAKYIYLSTLSKF